MSGSEVAVRTSFLLVLLLVGCASPNVLLIHPRSGDMVECSSSGTGIGAALANSYVDSCVKQYGAAGFIRSEDLTPEQRAVIVPGKITRNRQNFISQEAPPAAYRMPLNCTTMAMPAGMSTTNCN